MHDSPTARVRPWQSCTPPNWPAPPPAPETVTGATPTIVTVTFCSGDVVPTTTLPKSKRVGVIRNCGPTPMPLKSKANGWPFRVPDVLPLASPGAPGVNAYENVQDSPTASVRPWQSCTPPNWPAPPPAPETVTGATPTFVTVTSWSGDVVPSWTSAKSKPVGETRNFGATPLPEKSKLNAWPFRVPDVLPVA